MPVLALERLSVCGRGIELVLEGIPKTDLVRRFRDRLAVGNTLATAGSPVLSFASAGLQPEMVPEPSDSQLGTPPESGAGILSIQNIRKAYKTRRVVENVSMTVRRGEAVGLLGPNGAGKTTTFYMITGLVRPDAGRITLDGNDVTILPMYRRARLGIGYLPQEASIFRGLSVEDNIRAVLEMAERDKSKRERELDGLLDEFDLTRLRKAPSIALSGGERRRCEIARARSPTSQASCCLMSRSPASIPSPSATFAFWCSN